MIENNYPVMGWHYCIDSFKEPKNIEEWEACPRCKLKPRVWVFDNGEHTACGCWKSKYDHFDVQADQTIVENLRRTGGFNGYDEDDHRKKWNEYCNQPPTKEAENE